MNGPTTRRVGEDTYTRAPFFCRLFDRSHRWNPSRELTLWHRIRIHTQVRRSAGWMAGRGGGRVGSLARNGRRGKGSIDPSSQHPEAMTIPPSLGLGVAWHRARGWGLCTSVGRGTGMTITGLIMSWRVRRPASREPLGSSCINQSTPGRRNRSDACMHAAADAIPFDHHDAND